MEDGNTEKYHVRIATGRISVSMSYSCNCKVSYLTFLYAGNRKTYTLANSEDRDEMPHYVVFHQGLHCLVLLICRGLSLKYKCTSVLENSNL